MTMNSSGSLGIGTNNPSAKLHIESNTDLIYLGTDRPWKFHTNGTSGSTTELHLSSTIDAKNFIIDYNGGNKTALFHADANVNDTRVYLCEDGGKVGVGTNNPSEKLEVNGGNIKCSGYVVGAPGSIICMEVIDFGVGSNVSTNSFTDVTSVNYTKKVGSSKLYVEIKCDYTIGGYGNDTFEARLKSYDGTTADYGRSVEQTFTGQDGGGSRSNNLTECYIWNTLYTVSGVSISFTLQGRRLSADDTITFSDGCWKIFEISI